MKLIAKKPCSFGGKRFYIGEEIPGEFVLNPKEQEKMEILTIVNDTAETGGLAAGVRLVVHGKEGDLPLDVTTEGLQAVVDILTSKPADATPIIEQVTDGDALILLHVIDNRKDIKAAAEARAKAISIEESAGEQ